MIEPGWYPDPATPTMVRWWDGNSWTNDARPTAGFTGGGFSGAGFPGAAPPPGGYQGTVPVANAATDLAAETKAGRWAALALLGGALAYSCQYLLDALLFGRIWRAIRDWANQPLSSDGTRPRLVLPHSLVALNFLSPVVSFALLGAGILFLLWFEKAATVASRAGLPARHSAGWAVGGWFVPILSFWYPYQSAIDMFPAGHPGRKKVNRWWALWLATQFASFFVIVGALISTGFGLGMGVVAIALAFSAAAAGRAVIDEVDRVHAGLVGR
jgi:hypothetical protein